MLSDACQEVGTAKYLRPIRQLSRKIDDIEAEIQKIMDELVFPITTILGVGVQMGTMILAEGRDFSAFDAPNKVLGYARPSSSACQSGQRKNCYLYLEKRGSLICAVRFSASQDTFVFETLLFPLTWRRNKAR